ncbi:sulfatase [Bacteroidota bacterium]
MKILRIFLIFVLCLGGFCQSCQKKTTRPNIVFILADDMGWADLPVYGNRFNEAPNLTRLASEGKQFMNAYAACPVCSPTRASIMSGQYPARVGIIDFITGYWRPFEKVIVPTNRTQYLPEEIVTIGEALKLAGYKTGYFGKWHLGRNCEHHPSNQGFDEAYEYTGGGYYNAKFKPDYQSETPKRLSEQLTDFSIDFIDKNKDALFFLFLAHYDVHLPLDADSLFIEKYFKKQKVKDYPCNAVYAAMIEHLDNSVGRILDKLEELDLSDNTIVIFFSDNGGIVRIDSLFDNIPLIAKPIRHVYEGDTLLHIATSNRPLRAQKGTVFEGGIRVPLIVRWPEKISGGTKSESIISSVDFYPTLVELAGGSLPDNQVLDGKSIVPELAGSKYDPERAVFWHYPVFHLGIPASAVRKGDWKLIHFLVDDHRELYNLTEDIGETHNLIDENPEKAEELNILLNTWRERVNAPFPEENPDFNSEKRYQWGRHPYFKNN